MTSLSSQFYPKTKSKGPITFQRHLKQTSITFPSLYLNELEQWRTQKIFRGEGVHSLVYGGHLCLVCTVCDVTIWRHIHVFKRSLL